MAVDAATGGEATYRESAMAGLALMLESQFENGAWPQRYPLASKGYSRWYTFNDNATNDCIQVMLDAYRIYDETRYLDSAKRGGDFIIASQRPTPQAGWAQQYDYDLKPVWARKFEPPSVCAAVTARNIRTLVDLYLITGESKYLRPIPDAIDWLKRSQIGENRWARFYELETNRPLYFNTQYELVYTDDDLPTHYSFQGSYAKSAMTYYERVKSVGREKYLAERDKSESDALRRSRLKTLQSSVEEIVATQDAEGRWLTDGRIQTRTFIQNIQILSDYLAIVHR